MGIGGNLDACAVFARSVPLFKNGDGPADSRKAQSSAKTGNPAAYNRCMIFHDGSGSRLVDAACGHGFLRAQLGIVAK